MSKTRYIEQITIVCAQLAQTMDTANQLVNVYFDRTYGAGGANQIVDDDLVEFGLSAGQVASAINLFQQLQALRNGGATVPGDYDATLNQVRRDI